jgi:hypothetical protein
MPPQQRARLWPMLKAAGNIGSLESWEAFADDYRMTFTWSSAYAVLGVAPYVLIFVGPSLASLAVTALADFDHKLWVWIAWLLGLGALLSFGSSFWLAERQGQRGAA